MSNTSCNEIAAEIAALRADIAALSGQFILKSEKSGIISDSVKRSEASIIPKINPIASAVAAVVFGQKISPFSLRLGRNERLTGDALSKARQGLERAYQAQDAARKAGSLAGNAMSKAVQAAIAVASLAFSIAGILAALGTFLSLKARIDALENYISRVAADLSRAFGQITTATSIARDARGKADDALLKAVYSLAYAQGLGFLVSRAQSTANKAQSDADFAKSALDQLKGLVAPLPSRIDRAQTTADGAKRTSDEAKALVQPLPSKIDRAQTTADGAKRTSDEAKALVQPLPSKIDRAQTTADEAKGLVAPLPSKIDRAQTTADGAKRTSDEAKALVQPLPGRIDRAQSTADEAKGLVAPLPSRIDRAQSTAENAKGTADAALGVAGVAVQGVSNLGGRVTEIDRRFSDFIRQNQEKLNIQPLQPSELNQEFDRRFADFQRLSNQDANTRFNEFIAKNRESLNIQDLKISKLGQDFNQRFEKFKQDANLTAQQRFDKFAQENQQKLNLLRTDINKVDNRIKQREAVDLNADKKLSDIVGLLGLIPGRVNDTLRPNLLTQQQVQAAAGRAICQSANGGCLSNANNNLANKIGDNINKSKNDVLNKLNAGANAGQLALLQKIDNKLGAQITGGIGGHLTKMSKWLQLDKAVQLMTLAATIHNAAMLSNELGTTLLSSISNVLAIVGIKDQDGNALNFGNLIGNTVEAIIKGAVGDANYVVLSAQWQKAVRVYQATANIISSITNVGYTIINALEIVGGNVAKIGNALKFWGEIGESAYNFMNPQPNFQSKVFVWLEDAQQGASVIQQVTQAPLDVTQQLAELEIQRLQLLKDIKQDAQSNPGFNPPAAEQETAKANAAKDVSKATLFNVLDTFNAND